MIYVDKADDLAFLTRTPAQTKLLLLCLEQMSWKIGICMNANKTVFIR